MTVQETHISRLWHNAGSMRSPKESPIRLVFRSAASSAGWRRLWRWVLSPPERAASGRDAERAEPEDHEQIAPDQDHDDRLGPLIDESER